MNMTKPLKANPLKVLIVTVTAAFSVTAFSAQANNIADDIERVRAELIKMIPPAIDAEIVETAAENVYRMDFQGNYAFVYVTGEHVLIGELLNTKDQVNLGDAAKAERIATVIEDVPISKMIIFGPQDAKRHITVFTDIDCGYCRKLHNEVTDLTDAGIQVRYLAFPRAGVGSESHKKYVSVWCNADQQSALTTAKNGGSVPAASCENPVTETYNLGQQVGVRGTPTIIFDDGTLTPGYLPSAELIRRLGIDKDAS
ncbi:MAG: thiol:disulfide interchange protein DsbC [Arenicella sp.]|jgi:thiol:disulfide interchange protein DsbC